MKILYLHPYKGTNLGDNFTLEGSKYLMTKALGDHEIIMADLAEVEGNPEVAFTKYKNIDIDIFVVSGTPWIWDCCTVSKKYKALTNLLEVYKNKKKIAMGIGSCYPVNFSVLNNLCLNPDKKEFIKELNNVWSQFDLIFTRDTLASKILEITGVKHFDEICTSSQLKQCMILPNDTKKKRPSLIFYNPELGLSREILDRYFIEDYIFFQLRFIKEYNPIIYVIEPQDLSYVIDKLGLDAEMIVDTERLLEVLNNSTFVLSGRIHAAIPARMLGVNTFLMPVDSRYLTAVKVGVTPIFTQGLPYYDFENLRNEKLNVDKIALESQRRISTKILKLFEKK
jgi:hypothetical protein